MAYKVSFTGLDDYIERLEKAGKTANGTAKRALYEGAAVMATAMKEAVLALPVSEDRYHPADTIIGDLTPLQKQELANSMGITRMEEKGADIQVKIGFDGYNSIKTQKHPTGQPNQLLANSINSGTSRRPKRAFVPKAKKSKDAAEAAMVQQFDKDMAEIFKE